MIVTICGTTRRHQHHSRHTTTANPDLTGPDLSYANLSGAVLDGVVWSNTICPDGSVGDFNFGSVREP